MARVAVAWGVCGTRRAAGISVGGWVGARRCGCLGRAADCMPAAGGHLGGLWPPVGGQGGGARLWSAPS